jgi:serine/threonine protein kinase
LPFMKQENRKMAAALRYDLALPSEVLEQVRRGQFPESNLALTAGEESNLEAPTGDLPQEGSQSMTILGVGAQATVLLGRELSGDVVSGNHKERLVAVKIQPLVDSPDSSSAISEMPSTLDPAKDDVTPELKESFSEELSSFRQEVKALKRVKGHPNIASLRDSFVLACAGFSQDDITISTKARLRRSESAFSILPHHDASDSGRKREDLWRSHCLQVLIFNLEGGSRDLVQIFSSSSSTPILEETDFGGRRIPEDSARTIFVQLLDALIHCHAQGVAHRCVPTEFLSRPCHCERC